MANNVKFAETVKVKVMVEGKAKLLMCKAKNVVKEGSQTTALAIVGGKFRRVSKSGKAKVYSIV
jgi:hypothetical protein